MDSPKTIGRYEILEELGHGAMGSVFSARDPSMGRVVAIKTILTAALASEQGREYRERFYREARAAGALAHPGIVPVFDVGEHEGVPFLVMEFVSGQTLSEALKKGGRLSTDRICEIGQQIAEALGYAHRKGVIHRDIKPANILLTSRETYGVERAKITDFGVAKLTAMEMTSTGQLLGTPAFMPPEQFTGSPIDGRADLFSLGVILYQMVTGEQPFPGETMTAVSYKVVHTEPIPPRKLNPAISAPLESVVLKCMAKSPAERYQTGEELAQELAALRAESRAAGMQATTLAATTGVSQATLAQNPAPQPKPTPVTSAAPAAAKPAIPPSAGKRGGMIAVIAVAVLAVAVFGVRLIAHRSPDASTQTAPSQAPSTPAPQQTPPVTAAAPLPAAPEPVPVTPPTTAPTSAPKAAAPAVIRKPSAAAANNPKTAMAAPAPPAASSAPAPAPAPAPQPRMASVAFDPKTLDPKQNTRLKLDLTHLAPGLAFVVQMNGKIYMDGVTGKMPENENLYVPPGVHEFVVVVSGGGAQKTSKTVSAEFVAKKHMTLKVELRPQAKGTPPVLDPAAQVIATLKMDRLFF